MKIGNLIYQWGNEDHTFNFNTLHDFTFPVTFPNGVYMIMAHFQSVKVAGVWYGPNEAGGILGEGFEMNAVVKNSSTFSVSYQTTGTDCRFSYIAIGW